MRRAQTTSAAKPPRIGRGFYIPVILATAGIHPFAIFPFARSANGNLLPKMANPLRRQSRRKFPPPKAALIYAAFCGATHSRIFPSCFARWFALRANSKNAAIIAYAIMTAPKARLDSRLRGNDNWGRWFSANAIFGTCGNDGGNDGGKWESTFAAPIFAPIVIVLVAKVVNLVVIVIASIIIGVSVVIGAICVVANVVIVVCGLTNSSLPCTMVIV